MQIEDTPRQIARAANGRFVADTKSAAARSLEENAKAESIPVIFNIQAGLATKGESRNRWQPVEIKTISASHTSTPAPGIDLHFLENKPDETKPIAPHQPHPEAPPLATEFQS